MNDKQYTELDEEDEEATFELSTKNINNSNNKKSPSPTSPPAMSNSSSSLHRNYLSNSTTNLPAVNGNSKTNGNRNYNSLGMADSESNAAAAAANDQPQLYRSNSSPNVESLEYKTHPPTTPQKRGSTLAAFLEIAENGDSVDHIRSPESAALLTPSPGDVDGKDKLSTLQKIVYGFPQFNCNFGNFMINMWLTYLYLPSNGDPLIAAGIYGTLFTVGRMLNATCDPLIGYASDHTKGKAAMIGRRRPYMLIGAPFLAITFGMLWFTPSQETSTANTVYFIFVFMLYNIFYSFCVAPYTALLPEICTSNTERVKVATFAGLFALLGNLAAAVIGPVQNAFKDGVTIIGIHFDNGLQICGLFGAMFHLLGFWLIAFVIKESNTAPLIRPNLFKEMWIAFRNPAFISLIGVSVLLPMGIIMVSAGLPYLCTEILETDDGIVKPGTGETWVGVISGILIGGAIVWMPFISQLVKKFGKKKIMLSCGAFMSFCILFISVVQFFPDPAIPVIIGVFFLSLPATASFVLPSAIYGDVVDYDYNRTGQRREGIYAGTQSFCNKSGWALSSALTVYLLSLDSTGSNISEHQDTLGISLIFVSGGLIVAIGTAIFATHPINH